MSDCRAVTEALSEGRGLDAAARAHVAGCTACRALGRVDAALRAEGRAEAPPMGAALRAALDELKPVEALSVNRQLLPLLLAAMFAATGGLVIHPRPDLAQQPFGRMALGVVTTFGGASLAWFAAASGGAWGLGWPASRRWSLAGALVTLAAAVTAAVTVAVEGSVQSQGRALALALKCGVEGSLLAGALGVLLFRRMAGQSLAPTSAGALAGLGAGCAGALAQHLMCAVMEPTHTLTAHLAPLLGGALLGALLGRRWLAL